MFHIYFLPASEIWVGQNLKILTGFGLKQYIVNNSETIASPLSSHHPILSAVPGRHRRWALRYLGIPRCQGLRPPRGAIAGLPAAAGGALRPGPNAVAAAPGAQLPGRW